MSKASKEVRDESTRRQTAVRAEAGQTHRRALCVHDCRRRLRLHWSERMCTAMQIQPHESVIVAKHRCAPPHPPCTALHPGCAPVAVWLTRAVRVSVPIRFAPPRPSSAPQVVMQGYLEKKSPKAVLGVRAWQKRYFEVGAQTDTHAERTDRRAATDGRRGLADRPPPSARFLPASPSAVHPKSG